MPSTSGEDNTNTTPSSPSSASSVHSFANSENENQRPSSTTPRSTIYQHYDKSYSAPFLNPYSAQFLHNSNRHYMSDYNSFPHNQHYHYQNASSFSLAPGQYDWMFVYPQSSIFATYLHSVQYTRHFNSPDNFQNFNPQQYRRKSQSKGSHASASSLESSPSLVPRCPPKKPKQSGFALWIGNLPPQATLADLCTTFGTLGIQSVFLIQRTSCAFVNYSSQDEMEKGIAACERRGGTIHGNRLVVKIKNSNTKNPGLGHARQGSEAEVDSDADGKRAVDCESSLQSKDRYFICKSLTSEDLHISLKLGLWVAQSHNQALLNNAYKVGHYNIFAKSD